MNALLAEWLDYANDDLEVAIQVFEKMYPKKLKIACYHSQQAIEKSFKGFLASNDVEPPKTHDLELLCTLCAKISPDCVELLPDCAKITYYATQTRYPDEIEVTEVDTLFAINTAKMIVNKFRA
ncbi:MAG: HEPN domain-containing protein [Thermoguttaceae bacterium]